MPWSSSPRVKSSRNNDEGGGTPVPGKQDWQIGPWWTWTPRVQMMILQGVLDPRSKAWYWMYHNMIQYKCTGNQTLAKKFTHGLKSMGSPRVSHKIHNFQGSFSVSHACLCIFETHSCVHWWFGNEASSLLSTWPRRSNWLWPEKPLVERSALR